MLALVIIYNHKYEKNIKRLELLYSERFSNIYHLVPFYEGDLPNVIPVYENSFYFQGYIAQGFKSFYQSRYDHYLFIGDDLIVNPDINEANYRHYFNLTGNTSFIPELISFHNVENYWGRVKEAFDYKVKQPGVEAVNELPSYDEAIQKFRHFNLDIKSLSFSQIHPKTNISKKTLTTFRGFQEYIESLLKTLNVTNHTKKYDLDYPQVGGYSDIFIVPAKPIKKFVHYCGVFAATKMFVEIAIPTALVLVSEQIVTEKETKLPGKPLWTKDDYNLLNKYNYNLNELLSNFPDGYLYIHPVKLSKWT